MMRWVPLLISIFWFAAAAAAAQPTVRLEAEGGRFIMLEDGVAWVPEAGSPPPPVMIVLHGAGGNAATALSNVIGEASRRGIAVVAVKSGGRTWDAMDVMLGRSGGGFAGGAKRLPSADRNRIARALDALAEDTPVDRSRLALFGFSDGASMALSLGVASPETYPFVVAFAPGGVIERRAGKAAARQEVVIAHGTEDRIIPYRHDVAYVCPKVTAGDRTVRFVTFSGGHRVDQPSLRAILDAFLDPGRTVGEPGCP